MNFFKKMFSAFICFLTVITSLSSAGAMGKSDYHTFHTCTPEESHSRFKMTIVIVSYDSAVTNDIIKMDKCRIKTSLTGRRPIITDNGRRYDVEFVSLPYERDKWSDEAYVSDFVLKNKRILSIAQYVLFVYNMGVQQEFVDMEKGGINIDEVVNDLFDTPTVGRGVTLWFKSIKSINRDCVYMIVGDYSQLESKGSSLKDEEVAKLQGFNSELSVQLERQLICGQLIPYKYFLQCRSFAIIPKQVEQIDQIIAEYLPELERRYRNGLLEKLLSSF